METEKITQVISALASEVFERPGLQLKPSDSPSSIKGWDSLTQVVLVAEIEKQFKIRFTYKDLASIANIGDIISIVKNKMKKNLENGA